MFLMIPSTKIAQRFYYAKKELPEPLIRNLFKTTFPTGPLVWFRNNLTEMFLMMPSIKIDQNV